MKFEIVSAVEFHLPILRKIFLHGRSVIDPIAGKVMHLDDFDKETSGELILVAIRNQVPIGFISIWLADNFIHHLYVEESNQSNGVGNALLHSALQWLTGRAELKCFVSNASALNFYQKTGFTIKETVVSESGDYHVLALELSH